MHFIKSNISKYLKYINSKKKLHDFLFRVFKKQTCLLVFSNLAIILFLIVIFTPFSNYLAKFFFIEPKLQKADAILVLGGGAYQDGTLTSFTIGREIDGIMLYKSGWGDKIIFAGDSGDKPISDAYLMKDLAVRLGVPAEDVLVGGRSKNTYQDLQEAKKIMEENKFSKVLLLTSSVHVKRSVWTAKKLGLNAIPATSSVDQYRQVSVDRLVLFWFELRELISMLIYKLNGWV